MFSYAFSSVKRWCRRVLSGPDVSCVSVTKSCGQARFSGHDLACSSL